MNMAGPSWLGCPTGRRGEGSGSGRRKRARGLAEGVEPALGRAHVGVAEPEAPVERPGPVRLGALQPEPGGDDGGVAIDPYGLGAGVLVLAFVDRVPVACGLEQ